MELELSDGELVRRIGGGIDTAAESQLVQRIAPRIRLYGLRHLRNECDAEDLTQEVPPTPFAAPRLDHDRLKHCVQNLNERERTVVVMSFYNEETGADVANFLGVSEANVRVIRHRAIHQIRHCMRVKI